MNPLEQKSAEFFLRQCVAQARTMSLSDARRFLHGLLVCCPDTAPQVAEVQQAFQWLSSSDDQLAQIEAGQMKLTFPE